LRSSKVRLPLIGRVGTEVYTGSWGRGQWV